MTNYTDEHLVRFWASYVGDPATRIKHYGGFFEDQLRGFGVRTVLDLAAGLGIDAIYLAQLGFQVSANEADPVFRSELERRVLESGAAVKILQGHDWRTFPGDKRYDAAILLGNSFTYLLEENERREALFRFAAITDKVLILDTRNYDFMHRHGEAILGEDKFPFKKKYYYTGSEACGYPISLDSQRVVLEIKNRASGVAYHILSYPLPLAELQTLILEAGFSHAEAYGDFSKEWDPEHTDFFAVVATK